jgi:hypothetical protein
VREALPQPGPSGGSHREPPRKAHIVLDEDDRIVRVGRDLGARMGPFVGHVLWERLPGAEPLLRPGFDQARATGRPVTFTAYYAGRVRTYEVIPAGGRLAVTVEHRCQVDVTSLETLARSLREIEAELASREPGRRDPPAPASRPAPP